MAKIIGYHSDNTKCYTVNCTRGRVSHGHDTIPSREAFMKMMKPQNVLSTLPLKEMDSGLLTQAILHDASYMPDVDMKKLNDALTVASYLHRNDMRSNRGKFDQTPYIEHPLRNTLRVMRYGCTNEEVLLGTILHDTVEDHAKEFSEVFAGSKVDDEQTARDNCYTYIRATFGGNTSRVVEGMSNPLSDPKERITTQQKNARYVRHVVEEIEDPKVFVSKFSDWVDNAVGLYHNVKGMNPEGVRRRAVKYSMLVEVFRAKLLDPNFDIPVTAEGRQRMLTHLEAGAERLKKLANPENYA